MSDKKAAMLWRAAISLSRGCGSARLAGLLLFLERCGCIVAILLLLAPLPARTDTYWKAPAGQLGDWSLASNWTGGLPNSSTNALIGNGGSATVNTVGPVCNYLSIGTTTGSGSFQIDSGSISLSGHAYIGDSGTGSVVQSGGTFSVAPGWGLNLGVKSGGEGTYTLTDGLLSGQCELLGNLGAATFIQSGGINSASGWLIMSDGAASTYSLSGTGLLSSSTEYIGYTGRATFTQSGGTNNVDAGAITVGQFAGANGTYSLSAGQVSSGQLIVSAGGTGTFIQSGGTNTTTWLDLGWGGKGTYDLNGGQFSASSGESVGEKSSGTFTQSGGTNTTLLLVLGENSTGSGTYHLNGGTLVTSSLTKGPGTAVFNFGGGTLKASDAFSVDFPITLTGIGGSAVVDTAGYTVALSGTLSGPGGLIKTGAGVLPLLGNNSHAGKTIVNAGTLYILSEDGLGSNPDHFTADQLTLNGGILQTAAPCTISKNRGITLGPDGGTLNTSSGTTLTVSNPITGSGSLTKTGAGVLTVSAANTYTGPTVVEAGSLYVHGTHNGGGRYMVANGATLSGSGIIASDVSLDGGAQLAPGPGHATLTIGSLSMSGNSSLNLDLDRPGIVGQGANDLIAVQGSVVLDGVIDMHAMDHFGLGSYTLLTYGGMASYRSLRLGSMPAFICPSEVSQGTYARSNTVLGSGPYLYALEFAPNGASGENLNLIVASVPEPLTIVLLGTGALGLLLYTWRRSDRRADQASAGQCEASDQK